MPLLQPGSACYKRGTLRMSFPPRRESAPAAAGKASGIGKSLPSEKRVCCKENSAPGKGRPAASGGRPPTRPPAGASKSAAPPRFLRKKEKRCGRPVPAYAGAGRRSFCGAVESGSLSAARPPAEKMPELAKAFRRPQAPCETVRAPTCSCLPRLTPSRLSALTCSAPWRGASRPYPCQGAGI